jgi:hypothetical protein
VTRVDRHCLLQQLAFSELRHFRWDTFSANTMAYDRWAFDGSDDGDGAKDTAAGALTGERGTIVAMGHGLCMCFGVCGETTKNKEESKIVNVS